MRGSKFIQNFVSSCTGLDDITSQKTEVSFVVVVVVVVVVIVVVVDVIVIIISFMQGIYTYIPETNHVPREYSVSPILSLLFMVPISLVPALALLYFYVSTF